jgi:hypothetical protein
VPRFYREGKVSIKYEMQGIRVLSGGC